MVEQAISTWQPQAQIVLVFHKNCSMPRNYTCQKIIWAIAKQQVEDEAALCLTEER